MKLIVLLQHNALLKTPSWAMHAATSHKTSSGMAKETYETAHGTNQHSGPWWGLHKLHFSFNPQGIGLWILGVS